MGFFDIFLGISPILTYKIFVSEDHRMRVEIEGKPEDPKEYARFWAFYWAKIMYNLGFPNDYHAVEALKSLISIAKKGFKPSSKFLEQVDKLYKYDKELLESEPGMIFHGNYSKKDEGRIIQTYFPTTLVIEREAFLAGHALLEYCLNKMIENSSYKKDICAKFFENVAMGMLGMYSKGVGGLKSTTLVPEMAFSLAVEHTKGI